MREIRNLFLFFLEWPPLNRSFIVNIQLWPITVEQKSLSKDKINSHSQMAHRHSNYFAYLCVAQQLYMQFAAQFEGGFRFTAIMFLIVLTRLLFCFWFLSWKKAKTSKAILWVRPLILEHRAGCVAAPNAGPNPDVSPQPSQPAGTAPRGSWSWLIVTLVSLSLIIKPSNVTAFSVINCNLCAVSLWS